MSYRIAFAKQAAKELDRLSDKVHVKVIERLVQLEQNPRIFGAEKLSSINAYKLRAGDLRIVYEIDDSSKTVTVLIVDDRKQVYINVSNVNYR